MNTQKTYSHAIKPCAHITIRNSHLAISNWNSIEHITITTLQITGFNNASYSVNNSIFKQSLQRIEYLICSDFKLVNFTNLNTDIKKIHFNNLSLRKIEHNYFKNLTKLKVLRITNNNINIIETLTFINLNKLTCLHLNNNKINTIEAYAFTGLYSIRYLNLADNSIVNLHIETFRIMDRTLTYLSKTLTHIFLEKNKLIEIKSGLFIFDNMNVLNLSNNQITTIQINSFNITNIEYIYLEGNQLSSIDKLVFYNIHITKSLTIFNNTIKCNCALTWITKHTKMLSHLNRKANRNIRCYNYNRTLLLNYIRKKICITITGIFRNIIHSHAYIYIYIFI